MNKSSKSNSKDAKPQDSTKRKSVSKKKTSTGSQAKDKEQKTTDKEKASLHKLSSENIDDGQPGHDDPTEEPEVKTEQQAIAHHEEDKEDHEASEETTKPQALKQLSIDLGIAENFFGGGGVNEVQSETIEQQYQQPPVEPEQRQEQPHACQDEDRQQEPEGKDIGIAQAFFAGGGVTEVDGEEQQPVETINQADLSSEQQRQLEEQRILEEQAAQNPDHQYLGSSLPDDVEQQMEDIINEQGKNQEQEAPGEEGQASPGNNQAEFEEVLRNAELEAAFQGDAGEGEIGFKETSGAHLAEVEGASDNKTEVIGEVPGFFSEAQNDNFTDVERLQPPEDFNQQDVGQIGFMDDDTDIQPNNTLDIQMDQQQDVKHSWQSVKALGIDTVGPLLMKNIFSIEPGALQLYSFRNVPNLYTSPELKQHYTKLITSFDKAVSLLDSPEELAPYLKALGRRHVGYGVLKEHYNVVGRALLLTLKVGLKDQFTPQLKQSWVALIRTVSAAMISDNYEGATVAASPLPYRAADPSSPTPPLPREGSPAGALATPLASPEDVGQKPKKDMVITLERRRIIEETWKRLTKDPELGLKVFINIFSLAPEMVKLFPFRNVKDLYQSSQLKTHGEKIIQIFNQVVTNLDNLEYVKPALALFGEQHIGWNVKELHFDLMAQAVIKALQEDLGEDFTQECQEAWLVVYNIITEIMLTHYDREENLFKNVVIEKEGQHLDRAGDFKTSASSMNRHEDQADGVSQGSANTAAKLSRPRMKKHDSLASISNEVWQHYKNKFRVEVDFHHKICYRFESAYRLNSKSVEKKKNLNLQIIDCIGEYSGYIEQDPMALFYCLYFCIFFKNEDLVEFLRSLIERVRTVEKIDRLLELIDTHGIDRLHQIGEQINQHVYHMVFYQAVDDNLRIVYAQIFKQLRFIQLRDKDALQLLNQRDYELIKLSFSKYTVKINLLQFYRKAFPLKASTYRKYNQAYFEEIVINNEIEQRVVMNYRERFLVTKEDIYIVFEMYCKEDYDEQFKKTKKDEITKKQFVDLFIICLRNDSFKIAMLIYTLYLNHQVDIDERMMDILMTSIKESIKFHELKLFFLHEHFDVLSISQLNQLLDIYQEILKRKEPKTNPMISQFNTIKITLLIYRICWKIEERQIYSLITKCSVLQRYLIESLSKYFEMQNNILVLYKFMSEPILHMTERKDSLDIMYEMNMSELLQHPVVVEVLNLVYEGKYSVSSSGLSLIQTFYCLLEMDTAGLKSITERLTQNIISVGGLGGSKQSSLQYNIWKQSIQQREQDEMFFTVLNNFILLALALFINLINNQSYDIQKEVFGPTFQKKKGLFLAAEGANISQYCVDEIESMLSEATPLMIFTFFVILTSIGSLTSITQKLLTFRFKDNVKLSPGQMLLDFSIIVAGALYMITYSGSEQNTVITDHCSNFIEISQEDKKAVDFVYTLRDPATQKLNFKLILSVIIIQQTISLILMLKRTQTFGELLMMLAEMMDVLIRFFSTFGLVIGLILVIGTLLGQELKEEKTTAYELFLDLFNAFNGNQEFQDFKMPVGQLYIGSFMYIFKILLLSLLAAMFINKYEEVYQNLDAHRRFNIIRMKNSVAYDKHVGGATLTFFPINILVLPFMIPIFSIRSSRASDFALKIQYVGMLLLYGFVISLFVLPSILLLYLKCLVNIIFISFTRKRQDYPGQNVKQAVVTVFLGPLIISLSFLIDLITITSTLLKPSSDFEHKYQLSEHKLNEQQMETVTGTLQLIFKNYEQKFKGHSMTLEELMVMHVRIFKIIDNLHDLTCKGLKNYKAALSNVQDYNLTKVLSEKCSIPSKNGEYKEARCEIDQIYFVSLDIELYNHIDVLLRKLRLGTLRDEMTQLAAKKQQDENAEGAGLSSKKREAMEKAKAQKAQRESKDNEEEDDEEKVPEGIAPYQIGPDGVPLKRNSTDVMNNFFIDFVSRSFTDIEMKVMAERANSDYKRSKKLASEIQHQQQDWRSQTAGLFTTQAEKFESSIRDQMYVFKLETKSKNPKTTNVKGDRFDKKYSTEETSVGTGF